MARPREAVGCRTLICGKADSSQLKCPGFARVFSTSPGIGTSRTPLLSGGKITDTTLVVKEA